MSQALSVMLQVCTSTPGDFCRTVLPVYEGHRWYFIEEHLHDVLGKLDLETGRHDAALQHFAAIIACPNSPAYWQAFYLKQFLDCVTATEGSQVIALGFLPPP